MLPTNSKSLGPCSPISAECVIWQGPEIACLNICPGDKISTVIADLANQLCTLLDTYNVSTYDLSCLNLLSNPADMQALIQLLINRICNNTSDTVPGSTARTTQSLTAESQVTIASCFQYVDPNGNNVTSMKLYDYVVSIGNQICASLIDITNLQNGQSSLNTRVSALETTVNGLTQVVLPTIIVDPRLMTTSVPQDMDVVLRAVMTQFLDLRTATGDTTDIYSAIATQGNLSNEDRLSLSGLMSSIPGWSVTPGNMSDSLNNLWLTILDLRDAYKNILNNLPNTCSDILLNFRANLVNSMLTIYLDGSTIPSEYRDCQPIGSLVTIKDILGNSTTLYLPIIITAGSPSGHLLDLATTSIDYTTDLTITLNSCLTDPATGTTCQNIYTYIVNNVQNCPALTLTPSIDTIQYSFTSSPNETYIVSIYDNGSTTAIQTHNISNPGATVNGTFTSLLSGTTYDVKIIIVDSLSNQTSCPIGNATTLLTPCLAPTNSSANITIP